MTTFRLILGTGLVLASASLAAAQSTPVQPAPDRWAPWLGCWQVLDESIQDTAALLDQLAGTASAPASTTPGALVCVTPAPSGAATMTTYVNDKPVLTETIVADGSRQPLTDPNCRGWQQAEWSAHGPRMYAKAEVTCGSRATRTVSGMGAIVTGPRWLDIQMIESEGRTSMRVRRYRRAADQKHAAGVPSIARSVGAMPIGGKLTLAEIKEASAKLPAEVVQAAVLELSPGGYELNATRLRELDSAGVSDSVIDLMVAMSFPEKFVVERASSGGGGYGYGFPAGVGSLWGPMAAWPYYYSDPFFYSSLYSPFGYNYWGYYDPYYHRGPGVIILNPGNGGVSPTEPSGAGRVVDGRGYTRIRRNEPEPVDRAGRGVDGGWGTASTGGTSSGSGSNGVSSGGYSSGGGASSGRTAVPRPPGGE